MTRISHWITLLRIDDNQGGFVVCLFNICMNSTSDKAMDKEKNTFTVFIASEALSRSHRCMVPVVKFGQKICHIPNAAE
jgi:hypothetical protein